MFGRAQKRGEQHIAQELLSAYLDKQVMPRERGQVERHLRACVKCAQELETLQYVAGLLRATPRVSVPRAFTLSEADVGRSAVRGRPRRRLSLYFQGATAVVAALLVVVVVGDVLTGSMRQSAAPVAAPVAAPMMLEKTAVEAVVVHTVVVEAAVEAEPVHESADSAADTMIVEAEAVVEDAMLAGPQVDAGPQAAAAEAPQMAKELGAGAAEEAPEAKIQALSVTPEGEQMKSAGGGVMPESAPAGPNPVSTVTALRALESQPTESPPPVQPEAEATPAPTAGAEEEAIALPTAPPATVAPQRAPVLPGPYEGPSSWWTLPRMAEAALGGLLVILLGLTLWLRRRP